MKDKKSAAGSRILWIILPFIFLSCLAVWYAKTDGGNILEVYSGTPCWDLSGVDLSDKVVRLEGGVWEFVPHAHLSPQEFAGSELIRLGTPSERLSHYTARLTVLVPEQRYYAISFNSVDYADRIYLNGELLQSVGTPATSAQAAVPRVLPVTCTVLPVEGSIEILHQVSNFVHKEGGTPTGVYIGTIDEIARFTARRTQGTSVIMGFCLLLFIVHSTLFLLFRDNRTNLYFALFCLVCAVRVGVTGPKVIPALFPGLSWFVTFRLEYISIPLQALFLSLALDALFPGLLHRAARRLIAVICALITAAFALISTVAATRILPLVYALILIIALYVVTRFLILFQRERDTEKLVVFCGLVIFVYLAVREMLYHADRIIFPVTHNGMLDFATIVIVLFQMTAVFSATMKQVARARENERRIALEYAALNRMSKLKSDMMATVSHELKTPLAVMRGFAQLASAELSDTGTNGQTVADLDAIANEAKRLSELVDSIGSVSLLQAESADEQVASLKEIAGQLERIYKPIMVRGNIELELSIPDGLPPVMCSADSLTQVLFNLLHNAERHGACSHITLSAEGAADGVRITVADNGRGMGEELLDRIFDYGVSGAEKGSGRGLAICKELIAHYGGSIEIASELDRGTAVCVFLRAAPASAAETDPREEGWHLRGLHRDG